MAFTALILASLIDFPEENFAARPLPKPEDKNYHEYLSTKESIRNTGMQNAPTVRPVGDRYEVADGSGRILSIKQLLEEGDPATIERYGEGIPVMVQEMSDIDSLCAQISGNHNVRKQPPAQLSKKIYTVMVAKGWTLEETAKRTGYLLPALLQLFRLGKLPEKAKEVIDSGRMIASNAYALCKLDANILEEDLDEWLEDAMKMQAQEFAAKVEEKRNEIRKARKGETAKKTVFNPERVMLKKEDLQILAQRAEFDFTENPEDSYLRGRNDIMLEIFQVDPVSVEKRKLEWDAAQQEIEKKKAERKAKREEEKAKEAIEYLTKHNPTALSGDILG